MLPPILLLLLLLPPPSEPLDLRPLIHGVISQTLQHSDLAVDTVALVCPALDDQGCLNLSLQAAEAAPAAFVRFYTDLSQLGNGTRKTLVLVLSEDYLLTNLNRSVFERNIWEGVERGGEKY